MSVMSYERHRARTPLFIKAMTLVNVALGLGMLLGWHQLAPLLEDPVLKLLGGDVGSDTTVFAYPFVVLWTLPLLGVTGTVFARSLDATRQAAMVALVPAILIGCSCLWLYLHSENLV